VAKAEYGLDSANLTVGLIIKERAYVTASFASGRWDMPAFYAAVFDWSSIQAAFLFSVFAFFLSRSEPFIQAISNTVPFRALRAYVLKSLILSLGLTLASLPLLISTPVVVSGNYINLGFLLLSVFRHYCPTHSCALSK
jgi:hypothetical protein